jgi:hypothetical protein
MSGEMHSVSFGFRQLSADIHIAPLVCAMSLVLFVIRKLSAKCHRSLSVVVIDQVTAASVRIHYDDCGVTGVVFVCVSCSMYGQFDPDGCLLTQTLDCGDA